MTASIRSLDEAGFEAALSEPTPLVVDFWAPWCGPCRAMAPAFEAAALELDGRVRFAKVNTDETPRLAARFGVRSIPTLILFEGGRETKRMSGLVDVRTLTRWTGPHA